MQGSKCKVQGCKVQAAGCKVQGAMCKVQGARCKVQGLIPKNEESRITEGQKSVDSWCCMEQGDLLSSHQFNTGNVVG